MNSRHEMILEELTKAGSVTVTRLAEKLNVSTVTIRKDLSTLEKKNKLYRSHGKAILMDPYTANKHINDKELLAIREKTAIGKVAAGIIRPNDTIIIGSGTTTHTFAQQIDLQSVLTVITSALKVSTTLSLHPHCDIIQLGGGLRHTSLSVVGTEAISALENYSCSKLFLGVDGLDLDFGLTTTNAQEAILNRKMIEASQKIIVLCDSSKFGRRGFSKICNLSDVDHIITDNRIKEKTAAALMDMGIEMTIVEVPED